VRKRIFRLLAIGCFTAIIVGVFVVIRDESTINSIRPGMPISSVKNIMGTPNIDLAPVPVDFLFRAPSECPLTPKRVLVYYRSNLRKSVLVFADAEGRVACVVRRQYMLVAH
jgi:hypothetical protein